MMKVRISGPVPIIQHINYSVDYSVVPNADSVKMEDRFNTDIEMSVNHGEIFGLELDWIFG